DTSPPSTTWVRTRATSPWSSHWSTPPRGDSETTGSVRPPTRSCPTSRPPGTDGTSRPADPPLDWKPVTKHIFVTGGVASGLGKRISGAYLGRLLKMRGLRVTMQKLDPYINVDPGTMNPLEHGEVFVTDDGGETDLDLGHYERFIDENLFRHSNATTGS